MNLFESIGGYFELELSNGVMMYEDGILLNSGRNCFEYILRAQKPACVYMPKFTCDVMFEPLNKIGIPFKFYDISHELKLLTLPEVKNDELIVYTNYLGLMDKYVQELSLHYRNQLVLDASQSFFMQPLTCGHTFYSPRKYFGVPDGGILYTSACVPEPLSTATSYENMSHLFQRIDLGAETAYKEFKKNDQSFSGLELQKMSLVTQRILKSIDYEYILQARIANYKYIHENLRPKFQHNIEVNEFVCPMFYPLVTRNIHLRKRLIKNKIFTPIYWPNIIEQYSESEIEFQLAMNTIPLPIDHRYDKHDMQRIIKIINES